MITIPHVKVTPSLLYIIGNGFDLTHNIKPHMRILTNGF